MNFKKDSPLLTKVIENHRFFDAEILAKLLDGDKLMFLLVQLFADSPQDLSGIALASAGDVLDVFDVDDAPNVFHTYCNFQLDCLTSKYKN